MPTSAVAFCSFAWWVSEAWGVRRGAGEKEGACTRRAGADDGFTASRCGLSGTGFMNETAGRHAVCSSVD